MGVRSRVVRIEPARIHFRRRSKFAEVGGVRTRIHVPYFLNRGKKPVFMSATAYKGVRIGCCVPRRRVEIDDRRSVFRAVAPVVRGAANHPGPRAPRTSSCSPIRTGDFQKVAGLGEGYSAIKTSCVVEVDRSSTRTRGINPWGNPVGIHRPCWTDRQSRRTDEDDKDHPAGACGSPMSIEVSGPTAHHGLNIPVVQMPLITDKYRRLSFWHGQGPRRSA